MKILVHTDEGDSNGLLGRFKEEGHNVFLYSKNKNKMLDGVVEKVESMSAGIKERPDFVLFDGVEDGEFADKLRDSGINVFGAGKLADDLEMDRAFGAKFMEDHGILVPTTENFKSIDDAIKFVKKNPAGYVIKMDSINAPKASSFVAKDDKEILDYLTHLKEKKIVKDGESFILQEFVKGVEVDTEVLYSHGRPVPPFNNDFETKRFLPGDLGPNSGCETSVLFAHRSDVESQILMKTHKKIFKTMEKEGFTCVLGFNAIVSDKDHQPYGLEWTARMGYSSIYAMCAMCGDADLGEMFYGLATGEIDKLPIKYRWGTSLRATAPPYPFEFPDDKSVEKKIYGQLEGEKIVYKKSPNIWLSDYYKNDEGNMVISGDGGVVAECTGQGTSLPSAWKISQKVFDDLNFPNKQSRYIDGIESATKRIKQLRAWGYDMPSPDTSPSPQGVRVQ